MVKSLPFVEMPPTRGSSSIRGFGSLDVQQKRWGSYFPRTGRYNSTDFGVKYFFPGETHLVSAISRGPIWCLAKKWIKDRERPQGNAERNRSARGYNLVGMRRRAEPLS